MANSGRALCAFRAHLLAFASVLPSAMSLCAPLSRELHISCPTSTCQLLCDWKKQVPDTEAGGCRCQADDHSAVWLLRTTGLGLLLALSLDFLLCLLAFVGEPGLRLRAASTSSAQFIARTWRGQLWHVQLPTLVAPRRCTLYTHGDECYGALALERGSTSAQRLPTGSPAGAVRGLRVLRPALALPRAPSWKASWKSRIAASPAQPGAVIMLKPGSECMADQP